MKPKGPSPKDVAAKLGSALRIWGRDLDGLVEQFGSIDEEWKPSKADFGWMCLLKHNKKTLVYLTPEIGTICVAVVLGERAVAIALDSDLPTNIKTLIKEARPYAEGRGIRFLVNTAAQVRIVCQLISIKTTPK